MRVAFGDCVFDPDTRLVTRNGRAVPLSPKAFTLLETLLRARPKALAKAQIREALWPGTFVSESNLANLVLELRGALGDDARDSRFIRTVRRFGYAFSDDARSLPEPVAGPSTAESPLHRLIWGKREMTLDEGDNLIGRDRNVVVWIDDESVSRRHARIVVGPEGATLEDLGSKNGTYLHGERIREPQPLSDRDEIRIGPARMVLRIVRRTGSTVSKSGERAPR